MKLPDEVKRVERSLHADEEEKLYEAIVRDCAKVCSMNSETHPNHMARSAVLEARQAILARYGLEPQEKQI